MEAQVREVLRRVLEDDEFLNEMLTNPERALRDYDLTSEERSVLTNTQRDLVDLMRIGGESHIVIHPFDLTNITLEIDLTHFITTLDLDLIILLDLTGPAPEVEELQEARREQAASLAAAVRTARAGAERMERIQELLEVVGGATELARRSSPASPGGDVGEPQS
jgi:hypothetical protein